jgi:hypothetical protein
MMSESYHSELATLYNRLTLGTINKEQYLNRAKELQDAAFEQMPAQRICGWHEMYTGEALVLSEGKTPASHGACSDCEEKMLREVEAMKEGKR